MKCEATFGQSFFILLGLIPSSIFVSIWTVARFIWLPWVEKLNNEPDDEVRFDQKYILTDEDYELLNNLTDYTKLKDKFMTLTIPPNQYLDTEYDICFRYCHKNEGFEYWGDVIFPYKILEAVARKYVKQHSCVKLYIDRIEMLQISKAKIIKNLKAQIKKEEEEEEEEEGDEVFATFKSYNKGDGQNSTYEDKTIPAAKFANKYSRRGKYKEAPIFEKKKEEKHKDVSYLDWFNLNSDHVHQIQGED
jgi:hypothetical protein